MPGPLRGCSGLEQRHTTLLRVAPMAAKRDFVAFSRSAAHDMPNGCCAQVVNFAESRGRPKPSIAWIAIRCGAAFLILALDAICFSKE